MADTDTNIVNAVPEIVTEFAPEPEPPAAPAAQEPTATDLAIYHLIERLNKLEENYGRQIEVLRADIGTTYKELTALHREFEARFGSQFNCPHCHRKLDAYSRAKPNCPICGGKLSRQG